MFFLLLSPLLWHSLCMRLYTWCWHTGLWGSVCLCFYILSLFCCLNPSWPILNHTDYFFCLFKSPIKPLYWIFYFSNFSDSRVSLRSSSHVWRNDLLSFSIFKVIDLKSVSSVLNICASLGYSSYWLLFFLCIDHALPFLCMTCAFLV